MADEDRGHPPGGFPTCRFDQAGGGLPAKPEIIALRESRQARPAAAGRVIAAVPGHRAPRPARRRGAGPGPLEVVAAQPARHVHHLADEVQAGLPGLQGLGRQVAGVHPAGGDLGLAVALGAGGHQLPAASAPPAAAAPCRRPRSPAAARPASCCTQASASARAPTAASSLAISLRERAPWPAQRPPRSWPGARSMRIGSPRASSWRSAAPPGRSGRGG